MDAFTKTQAERFAKMSAALQQQLGYGVIRHIANSAAIHRHLDLQLDMVRLGIGMYGVDSVGEFQDKLRNVSTLKTTVAQVKRIPARDTVGYGATWKAGKPAVIATVRIGYADGYKRLAGQRERANESTRQTSRP